MSRSQPILLLAATKWWPLAARLAVALKAQGCEIVALCPPHHPLSFVAGIADVRRYRSTDSLGSLRRALEDCRPDVVVPCDDGVVAQLHALHAAHAPLRPLIEASLGAPESYPVVRSRHRLLELAAKLGIRVPPTRELRAESDLAAWHADHPGPVVVKVDGENGGNGVRVCATAAEAAAAYRRLHTRPGLPTSLKRWIVNRDPLALWRARAPLELGMSAQAFIAGRPANCMLACRSGALLGVVSVVVVASEGPTGAATVVRVVCDEEMREAAARLSKSLGLTGFYGLDFIIESGSRLPYLIEMNPRCTQLGHLELPLVGSLAGAFAGALPGVRTPLPHTPLASDIIALFPQARAAGPACAKFIESGHHDVPHGETRLIEELMRQPWPARQWAARLYHAFNRVAKAEPTLFETTSVARGPESNAYEPLRRAQRE